jgi:modulator of FtsH protease
MNVQQTTYDAYGGGHALSAAERNRVLRNTYALLALSMVPTVLGAWIGVTTGIAAAMSPGISMIVFLAGAFGFMFAIEKTKNSAAGVPMLLAFTFFMGVMLSRLVGMVLGLGAIMLLVAGIANFFIQSSALMITLAVLAIGIFSAFILHDLKRVQDGYETNYITATLGVYLSIYNVFQSLLMLLGIVGGNDD